MGLTARGSQTLRARSRAAVSIIVLASWFGTLLVAAPITSPAAADPADPAAITIAGPASPSSNETPTWTFVVPVDDDPGSPTAVPADVPVQPSDTATATIATTHRPVCFVGTSAPSAGSTYADCADPTGTLHEFTFTAPTLPAEGSYRLYVHDVETSTITTTIEHGDGSQEQVVTGPTEKPGANAVSAIYVFDTSGPSLTFDSKPPASGTDPTPTWSWTAGADADTVACSFSDGTTTTTPTCATSFAPTLADDGTYTLTVTATDALGHPTVISSSYSLVTAGAPGVSVSPTTGNDTSPTWTLTPPAGTTPTAYSVVLSGPSVPAGTPVVLAADPTTHAATYSPTLTPANNGTWTLTATATVDGRPSASAFANYDLDTTLPVLTLSNEDATSPATPAWTVTTDEASAVPQCTLTGTTATGTPVSRGPAPCDATPVGTTYTYVAATLAEGSYTLTVDATDAVGNAALQKTDSYLYDVTKPQPPVITGGSNGNAGYATTLPLTWHVATADPDVARVDCVISYAGTTPATTTTVSPCGPDVAANVQPGQTGSWTLTATAVDNKGLLSDPATDTVVFDPSIAPIVVVRNGGTAKAPTWHVTVDGDATATCSASGGVLSTTACTNTDVTLNLTGQPGAVYTLHVTAVDLAGNVATPVDVEYALPPDAPVVTVASQGASRTPAWSITAQPGTTLTCTLVDPATATSTPTSCANGMTPNLSGADGVWRLRVVASYQDTAGTDVVSAVGTSNGYRLDTAAPGDPTVAGTPVGQTKNGSITWTVSPAAGENPATDTVRVDCAVYFTPVGGTRALDHAISSCDSTSWNLGLTTTAQQGDWQIEATAYDAVGNASAAVPGPVVTFDITKPTTPQIVGLTTPSNDAAPMLTINKDTDATLQCAWTVGGGQPTWQPCQSFGGVFPIPPPATDGVYTLNVIATDPAGNVSDTAQQDYRLDQAAPLAPGFSTPTSPSSSATVSWTVTPQPLSSGPEVNYVAQCQLFQDTGTGTFVAVGTAGFVACPASYTLSAENSYRLQARIIDEAGNTGAVGTSATYTYDKTPPQLPTVSGPAVSPSQSRTGTWTLSSAGTDGGTSLQCRNVDNGTAVGSFATCTSPYTRTNLADGSYALQVRAVDDANNASAFVTSGTYVVDNGAPLAPAFTGTNSTGNVLSTRWNFGSETGSTATCTLLLEGTPPPGTQPVTCQSGDLFDLKKGDGNYTLEVFLTDQAGNVSAATVSPVYLLDTQAPAAPVVTVEPVGPANSKSASYTFTSETGSTAECRMTYVAGLGSGSPAPIDPGTWSACTSPWSTTLDQGDGRYRAEIRVTDAATNVSATGMSGIYVLDTTGPLAPTFDTGPSGTANAKNVTWTWSGETPSTGSCTLSRTPVGSTTAAVVVGPTACNSGTFSANLTYGDGLYKLAVQLTDATFNPGAVATSAGYNLDATPPGVPTVVGPPGTSNDTTADYFISSTVEAGATAECKLTRDGTVVVSGWDDCTLPQTIPLADDGSYVLQVRLTDQYGNLGAAGDSPAYLLDTKAPLAPDLHGPTGTANTRTARYLFTAEASSAAECRLLFVATGTAGAPQPAGSWTSCTSPWDVSLTLGDGRYQAQAHVTDLAGNVSPDASSEVYELDTTGPLAPTFSAQPTGTAKNKDVTWSWTGETPTTGVCRLLFTPVGGTTASVVAGPLACDAQTYSTTLSAGDGFYQLTVRLTDPSLNAGALATSVGYTLDTTPPGAPTVSGPTGTSNKTAADYAIVGPVEALATAECKLTRDTTVIVSDWASCTMPRTITLAGDGSYVLQVRLTDQYGNLGAAGASPAFLLDTKLPTVPVVTAPSSPSSNGTPAFTITTDSDTTTTCRVTRGSVVAVDTTACTGPYVAPLGGQPDGDYVLSVTAKDPAGNTATGESSPYIYDTTRPVAPIVTGPAGPAQLRSPVFSWTGEAGARPECSLQEKAGAAGPWLPCATPYAPTLATDGSWVLSVRLIDAAGNVGDVGLSGAYLLDTTAPATPTVAAPTSPGRDQAPSWSAATEEGSRTECRLSGPGQLGTWGPCTLPVTTTIITDGTYTFEVRATDAAGNVSQPGAGTYVLDTTAPGAPVVVQPTGPGRNRTPSIAFGSEAGTTATCKLTRGTTLLSDAAPCTSPTTLNLAGLPDGAYTLSVRAVDTAGNIGPAGTATYVLDTTAPAVPTWTLIAGSPSSDRAPQFGFNAELGSTLSCKVTLPSGAVRDLTCTSPLTLDLSGATDGDYVLNVRASDPAGNVSAPATTTYHFDSSAPAAPRVVGPTTPGSIRNPVWRITSSAPAECRLLRGTSVMRDWTACGTSYSADLFAQPDAVYILEARVVGTTAATMSRYRLDTTGPAAATLVGPPSPSTDRKPTWAVASADTTVRAECRVMVFTGVLKDWAPCAVSPAGSLFVLDLTGLGDGTFSLLVRLTDAAGNVGPIATSDYVLDTSAPAAVGVIAPLSPGNDTTPTWTLTSAAGVKLECRLSSGQKVVSDFAPCAGAFTADLTGLPDGTYTLTVHALSAAGTPGPETTSGYILDTTAAGAPGTLTGPTGPSRNRAPRWTFSLAPGTTAVCKVTFGGKVFRDGPCSSPFTLDLSNAADGTYTLTVRAVDNAGNLGAPSTAGYILKTTPPPAPVLTMSPGSPSSTTDPTWGFSLARGTSGQCRLLQNGNALEDFTPCGTAGATNGTYTALLSGKPDGRYTMQVRAVDEAQNTSPAVGSDYEFDRSAAPLAVFIDTPPTPGNDLTPTWVVAAPAAQTTPTTTTTAGTAALIRAAALTGTPQTECRLTTPRGVGTWAPCSGRYVATTNGDGTYLLEVRAFDTAGERGPASSSSYTLDTRAPAAPRLTDPIPPAVGNDAEVAWTFADEGNLVQCHLLRNGSPQGGFADCDLLYVANVGRTGEATYTLEARAVDAAGNVSPVSSASYRYDITPPPAPTFTSRPAARGSASSVSWTFAVPVDTRAVCVVTRNGTVVSEGACAGAFTLDLRGQQPATWALSVHLVDAAGNAGPSSVGTYALLSSIARGRVNSPVGNGPGAGPDGVPGGPGAGPGAGPGTAGPIKPVPGIDREQPRAGAIRIPQVVKKTIKKAARVAEGVPFVVPGTNAGKAIKNVLGQTITKPQLPLALFIIVLLFLLVQNRIDRRDPKLAVQPADAEPELTFGPILRPGGVTA